MADDNRRVLTRGAPSPQGSDSAVDTSPLAVPERLYEALRSERRRALLRCLVTMPERVVELDELAGRVAAEEGDARPASRPIERSVAISLHHKHLPVLNRAGLIEYDSETRTVTYDCDPTTERQLAEALDP